MSARVERTVSEQIAEILRAQVNKDDQVKEVSFSMSLRLPISLVAFADTLGKRLGKSRNKTMAIILEAGMESLVSAMDEEDAVELAYAHGEAVLMRLAEHGGLVKQEQA